MVQKSNTRYHYIDTIHYVVYSIIYGVSNKNSSSVLVLLLRLSIQSRTALRMRSTGARRTIGLLYHHFYLNSNSTSLQKLYLTLVRPLLEYACQVWHPHLVRDIAKLERVQKLALRLCTKQWTLDYSTLLSLCNLPALETRRKYFCLCTMYKTVNKLIDFPPDIFVQRVTPFHSASDQLFHQPNAFMYSYVPGSCHIWNSLPMSIYTFS